MATKVVKTMAQVPIRPDSTFEFRLLAREQRDDGKTVLHVQTRTRPLQARKILQQYRQFTTGQVGNGEARVWFIQGQRYVSREEIENGMKRIDQAAIALSQTAV